MKNWRFSTNISLFENGKRYGHSHSYNRRRIENRTQAFECRNAVSGALRSAVSVSAPGSPHVIDS